MKKPEIQGPMIKLYMDFLHVEDQYPNSRVILGSAMCFGMFLCTTNNCLCSFKSIISKGNISCS